MGKYLDPKADLTFKKIFGEHKNLVISLLNALLPLKEGEWVESIEYWPAEKIPNRTEAEKYSIVDVCCKDNRKREFIVEMQMCWTADFKDRALFNSAKVYVDQLEHAEDFSLLRPVYSLNLVDAIFEKDVPEFIHHYKVVHEKYTDKLIEGFHIVFVELPKFKPQSIAERKMAVLWLRFLTEINKTTERVPDEFLESSEISQAVKLVEESAYTREQLMGYDLFWDAVRVAKTLASAPERSYKAGLKDGEAKGKEKLLLAAHNLKAMNLAVEQIAKATGLTVEEVVSS